MQEESQKRLSGMHLRRMANLCAAACLAWLTYWTIRFGYADYLAQMKTESGLQRAVQLARGNAQYCAWLAELQEHAGESPDAILRTAAALDPLNSSVWIQLGLRNETEKNYAAAEKCLREAARVDRMFDPRWSLMNYYFRRADMDHFWLWAGRALEMSYGDLAPIFRLCWRATNDPSAVRRIIPDSHAILSKYLSFLLAESNWKVSEQVACEVASRADGADLARLLTSCDRSLEQSHVPVALTIWNALCARRVLPYAELAPARGAILTNGDFAFESLGQGFDWHDASSAEITAQRSESPAGMKVSLSGRQAEACDLLWQRIPLDPGAHYRFRFHCQTTGVDSPSGLRWRVVSAAGNTRVAQSSWLAADEWKKQEMDFTAGDEDSARLALVYERAAGTTRLEGSIRLRNLVIERMR